MNTHARNRWLSKHGGTGCKTSPRLTYAFLIIFLVATILPVKTARAQETSPVYTFPECQQIEEADLRDELNEIAQSALAAEQSELDVAAIVDDNWIALNMDAAVDAAVDEAAEWVLREEDFWSVLSFDWSLDLFFSAWSPEKATELATEVANYAFDSSEFRAAVDQLSQAIVDDLAAEIQVMTIRSATSALLCVQEFIGATFSQTMAVALEENIQERIAEENIGPAVNPDLGAILKDKIGPLGGIAFIIGTQIAKLLAKQVTQGIVGNIITRILGRAASTTVPVVGWIIGVVLIAVEVWQAGTKGSIPQIRATLKAEDTKKEIRNQITEAVDDGLSAEGPALARSVADNIFGQWQAFLKEFEPVLRLAESNARFREILDSVTADQVDKLTELITVEEEVLGAEGLAGLIDSGQFKRIFDLPQEAVEILRVGGDPELVIAWADLAGEEAVVQVVKTELYRVASPSDFKDRGALAPVFALQDPGIIQKLMRRSEADREALLRLPTAQTQWVFTKLLAEEVAWLAAYLQELPPQAADGLVDYAMRERGLISILQESEPLRARFPRVLALADAHPDFQTILNATSVDQVEKLSELVAVADATLKAEQLTDMIDAGQFERILALPEDAFEILRVTGNPALVLAWADLAGGESVVQVVGTGLHRVAEPSAFREPDARGRAVALQNQEQIRLDDIAAQERKTLERVLALEDPIAIRKLMPLNREERDVLIELPTGLARAVLATLAAEDLSWLTAYLAALTPRETVLTAAYISQEPGVLPKLMSAANLQSNLPGVLTLAQDNPQFRTILNSASVDEVGKLSELVAGAIESLTPEQLARAIDAGQLERILALPEDAFEILREKGDPALVLAWADLAGAEAVARVVETALYRVASPSDFRDREALEPVLALEDQEAIGKLMQLHQLERVVLLGLSTDRVKPALIALSVENLSWLALYLAELAADEKEPLVGYILQEPGLIPILKESEDARGKFPRALLLALANPSFETILNSASVDELEKLSELVAAADATMTQEQLDEMIGSGQFERVFALPQAVFDILRVTGNPALVLAWGDLADEAIVQVVETGLYRVASPSEFDGREALERALALEDPVAIQKLKPLNRVERGVLLELSTDQARSALIALSAEELAWLAAYLPELLSRETGAGLVDYILRKPTLLSELRESERLRSQFPRALNLARTNPRFKRILDGSSVAKMDKLTALVTIADETLGPEQLTDMIDTGQFERIVALPQAVFDILREKGDPALVLAWADLAGEEMVAQVVETGVYRVASPDEFVDRGEALARTLALAEPAAVEKLMELNRLRQEILLGLPTGKARSLVNSLAAEDLTWLATSYLAEMQAHETEQLTDSILRQPALLSELKIENVPQALLESQNKEALLEFLLRRAEAGPVVLPTLAMLADTRLVLSGVAPWPLYLHYYAAPALILLSVVVGLIILGLLWRWRFRRQRAINGA